MSQPKPSNHLHLCAEIVSFKPLRYTPAGVPVLDLELKHESTQREAGQDRQTLCTLRAIAFGLLAEQLARQALGQCMQFGGFLAAGKNGKGLIFHLQSLEPLIF